MGLHDFNILIVDDDRNYAESLKQAVLRSGFRCYIVHNPEDALSYVKIQDVHAVVIDCMLPKMNGLELVQKIKSAHPTPLKIFLMSGIFKDKQFISSSLKKTEAVEFYTKPFEVKELISKLESLFSGVEETEDNFNPLVRLYLDREENPRKVIKLINNAEGLHNFDLPWVFRVLLNCRATGHLNIACTNGDIAGVGFSNGEIVQVNIKNEASLLGLLLVEQGYLNRNDLNEALEKNANSKLIGHYLVEHNYVSPHAINIVLKEQLIWRLKRLIADSQMELNFVKSEDIATIACIDEGDFSQFLVETIENIIRPDWFKTHYMGLSQNMMSLNDQTSEQLNRARMIPMIARTFPSFEALMVRGTSLEEIIAQNPNIENNILKVIHYFNVMGYIKIQNVHKTLNFNHQAKRLQKLQIELESKNYFERLGVSRSAKEPDIRKAYFDLAKVLHPDKLSENTPAQIKELSEKVFDKIQVAYDTLKKDDRKEAYLQELAAEQSEKMLQADQIFESGRKLLYDGHYSQAKKQIQKAAKIIDNPDLRIHSLWCDIKTTNNPAPGFIADIDKRLNQIPLEARDTPAYYLVRGLYYVLIHENDKAKKYFSTAMTMDHAFISARRELSQIKGSSKKEHTSILTADLKDIMNLFKKSN